MSDVSQILGFVGTIAVAIGYLPQIRHLAREHCSAGVSIVAWQIWLLSGVLIICHAIQILDFVFIALQIVQMIAIVLIIFLARRYQGRICAFHRLLAQQALEAPPG